MTYSNDYYENAGTDFMASMQDTMKPTPEGHMMPLNEECHNQQHDHHDQPIMCIGAMDPITRECTTLPEHKYNPNDHPI